ncbi:BlaI/MecI/CopY family transcriptional regulator [Streptomyces gobiensis]|uniref:BlaI/MecI/CopY family transcriptional regulator n=1 Tax=Streptomyces gobiensis TaxID=2875706 RepID=UPI001E4CFA74|nr:BlaI/MecI/CopY family transcriptional regulator [Streptomyces gobiensis]UGY91286.1 BlaI/MecI/CopY family transcriptional regulator [Streptomyces gobiensis]
MSLGSLESEVMRVCWEAEGPVTVRTVLGTLNEDRPQALAYTTVMTVMSRLAQKGLLARAPQGRGYTYTPAVEDEAALAVREVLRTHGDAVVVRFATEASLDPALRDRLRRLLEDSQ